MPICLAKKRQRRLASRLPCKGLNSGWGSSGSILFPVLALMRVATGGEYMGGMVRFL